MSRSIKALILTLVIVFVFPTQVMALSYNSASSYSNGLAVVMDENERWGYIDQFGKTAIDFKYNDASGFSEGLAAVADSSGKYGYINSDGSLVIPHTYKNASPFTEGLAAVSNVNGAWGFIDKSGNTVIDFTYSFTMSFSDGLAAALSTNGKWGYIDKSGSVAIPFSFDSAGSFSNGLAAIADAEWRFGYINKSGSVVVPCKYVYAQTFAEDLAPVKDDSGKWGYINNSGTTIIAHKYAYATPFSDRLAAVMDEYNHWGFINKADTVVVPLRYLSANSFADGMALVTAFSTDSQVSYYVDKTGKEYTSFAEYDSITDFADGYAVAIKNGALSVVSNPLTPTTPNQDMSDWAKTEVTAALEAGIVPESISSAGWLKETTRLAAADAIVSLIEQASGKTKIEIAVEHGWDLSANAFSDTDSVNAAFLRCAGVTSGVGNNLYSPDAQYTRAELVTMLGRTAEKVFGIDAQGANPFTDEVPAWAAIYVGYAADNGITSGIGDGKFGSTIPLQNQQTAIFIYRTYNVWK